MCIRRSKVLFLKGVTLVELMVALGIVATLAVLFVTNFTGLRQRDNISKAGQMLLDDILYIRSRSISTNSVHRISFTSNSQWRIEQGNGAGTWTVVSDVRRMPPDTNLTSTIYPAKATGLEATSRGLFNLNSLSGVPFYTIESLGVSGTKSINIDVGGAIEMVNN